MNSYDYLTSIENAENIIMFNKWSITKSNVVEYLETYFRRREPHSHKQISTLFLKVTLA